VATMRSHWRPHLTRIEQWRQDHGAPPVLFTELGYRSVDGAAAAPWDFQNEATPSAETQARAYEAFFREVYDRRPWLHGVFFWWWDNPDTFDWAGE